MSPEDIRHDSVLPARRQDIELHTADGLTLVGELALPLDRPPVATLVTVHPLPTHGGFMDSHVLRKAAARLPALADLGVLRFNLRGVSSPRGTSQGVFDDGVAERFDVAAAIEFAEFSELPRPWLLGWSFGTDLILRYGCDPGIEGAILLSPPLRSAVDSDLDIWAGSGKPMLVLVPELDDYLRPPEARQRFARIPQARVVGVSGARHLWVGEPYVRRVLDEIVRQVRPGADPLPMSY
jgi:uncharacterized protein